MKENNKAKGIIKLIIALILVGVLGYCAYTVVRDSNAALQDDYVASEDSAKNTVKLGLDLAGGVSITYQTVDPNPSDVDMEDTIYKLQKRVQNYSTEAEVYREGNNRINIDIPGVSDANAVLEELGKPGSLYFMDPEGNIVVDGTMVKAAQAGITEDQQQNKEYIVQLSFNDEGTKKFADATTKYVGQQIYIVYDDEVVSAPVVQEPITGGECRIDGMADYEEAENLASTIRIGSLSLELEELRSNVVGAKLGQSAMASSVKACVIGLIILAILLIVAFKIPGIASVLALAMYVSLEVLLLAVFNEDITLTLPGIAGIVLSIGMAVDANVIIFTRIKEEIGYGKTVESAVKTGFKKALSAIIDGNVTTLIAAVVLMIKGSGTVVGFAQTLALGIVISMFTALFVTRFILNAFIETGFDNKKFFGEIKERKIIDFVGKRKIFLAVSAAIIIAGFVAMGISKANSGDLLNYGIDFKGGTSTNVTFNDNLSLDQISSEVVPVVEKVTGDADVQTQKVANSNEVIIKTRSLSQDEREELHQAMVDNFGVDKEKITEENISGAISNEMKFDALIATAIALVLMLIYIWFRFKDIKFAASSVICLIHDVLIVLAFYAIIRWSVGSTFIACMLTLVGYSINATIVVFDRIRENIKLLPKSTPRSEIANKSITETLSRSIYSSLTTVIMVAVLYIFGVSSIKEFALPIMVGIIFGTYSSICIASNLWFIFGGGDNTKKSK